jgi:hypothetical protein
LGLAAGLHGAACWGGDPNQACGAAIIDGFTLPIGIFGGKAAESILEGVTGRTFLRGFAEAAARGGCDYLGGQISEMTRKLVTGS